MPIYALECTAGHGSERYVPFTTSENPPCEECAAPTERVWKITPHRPANGYPYVTSHISGKPIEVRSPIHEAELCKQFNVTKRDDVAYIEREYKGYDRKSGKQIYTEGSGRGMKGQWI